jgi:hypothetical protein
LWLGLGLTLTLTLTETSSPALSEAGGPSGAADANCSAGGPGASTAQLGAHVLPPGYLPFAAIAPGTQPTNDGRSGYQAEFANPNPNPNP